MVMGKQLSISEFKKMLESELKVNGVKYNEDAKMYFNVTENKVYCVSSNGKNVEVSL